jgi:hypothetical protein
MTTRALLCPDDGASLPSGNWKNRSGDPVVLQVNPKSTCDDSFELVVYDGSGVLIPSKTKTITPTSSPEERSVLVEPGESAGVRDPADPDHMGVTVAVVFP